MPCELPPFPSRRVKAASAHHDVGPPDVSNSRNYNFSNSYPGETPFPAPDHTPPEPHGDVLSSGDSLEVLTYVLGDDEWYHDFFETEVTWVNCLCSAGAGAISVSVASWLDQIASDAWIGVNKGFGDTLNFEMRQTAYVQLYILVDGQWQHIGIKEQTLTSDARSFGRTDVINNRSYRLGSVPSSGGVFHRFTVSPLALDQPMLAVAGIETLSQYKGRNSTISLRNSLKMRVHRVMVGITDF